MACVKLLAMRILQVKRQPLDGHSVYLGRLGFLGTLDLGKYGGFLRSHAKV